MAERYRLYLETSFWRRLGDPHLHERRRESFAFLRAIDAGRHQILVSRLVVQEIEATPDPEERRHILRRLWNLRRRLITLNSKILRIGFALLEAGGRGRNALADMMHLGYAVFSGADAVVTWDESDLARDHTRRLVAAYARRDGCKAPLIGTPKDVGRWLGIRIG